MAALRSYEVLYIVRPDLDKAQLEQTITKFQKAVNESGGQLVKLDEWGTRLLAYQIRRSGVKYDKAYYVLMEFTATPDQLKKIDERFKLDENILRYQIVRQDA
ncbi:MAG: 30S ribosomal protein S6 [Candidatus Bipolaricaulota bacterium]|nr:30S ribosomal protein S6 [Candidatus Bipolaricaulota bacterium]MDW8030748.1 30S ribosomal protein S6 [Candidatus Bipolaricaulota bacterium]